MKLEINLITHTNYINNNYIRGPADSFNEYLIKNKINTRLISLGFANCGSNKVFINGINTVNYKIKLKYIKYFLDIFFVKQNLKKSNINIAFDPISFITLYIFCKKNMLFLVDYSEQRSNNFLLNYIYQFAVTFSKKKAIFIISSGEKILEKLKIDKNKSYYLPNYPFIGRKILKKDYSKVNSVLTFTDINKVNYKFIIDSVKGLTSNNFHLDFIGVKQNEERLMNYIEICDMGELISYKCITDRNIYFNNLNCYNLGFDINNDELSYNTYRDPIKVREYIYFGIPIITNKNNSIYEEIHLNSIGYVLSNEKNLKNFLIEITNNKSKLIKMTKNIYENYKDLDSILINLFNKLEIDLDL